MANFLSIVNRKLNKIKNIKVDETDWLERSIAEKCFKYYEPSEFTDLTDLKEIGTGTFAKLYRAKWRNTGQFCTLKYYNIKCLKWFINEVQFLINFR